MPLDAIGQPEVLMRLSPIWTEKHETSKRFAQRIMTILDMARSKKFRFGEYANIYRYVFLTIKILKLPVAPSIDDFWKSLF